VIGLGCSASHIATGDEGALRAVIQELEDRGAPPDSGVCGGHRFLKPVRLSSTTRSDPDQTLVDGVVSLTGFALIVPGPQGPSPRIEAFSKLKPAPT